MAGQIMNRGKGVWLVRVYLGTDSDTGGARPLPGKVTSGGRLSGDGGEASAFREAKPA